MRGLKDLCLHYTFPMRTLHQNKSEGKGWNCCNLTVCRRMIIVVCSDTLGLSSRPVTGCWDHWLPLGKQTLTVQHWFQQCCPRIFIDIIQYGYMVVYPSAIYYIVYSQLCLQLYGFITPWSSETVNWNLVKCKACCSCRQLVSHFTFSVCQLQTLRMILKSQKFISSRSYIQII